MRRRARILKRSLRVVLCVLCVLAVASVSGRPAGSSPRPPGAAPRSATRSTMTRSTTTSTGPPPAATPSAPRTVATRFAAAYAGYLQGALPAERLPDCSPAARAMVTQSGPPPARLRVRQLRLTAVTGARGNWAARFAILYAGGRGEVSAQLLLKRTGAAWEIAEVVAPDLDTLLATSTSAARPTGPTAARGVAMGFTDTYLAYTYGHAGVQQLRELTPNLRAVMAGDPPRVSESIRRLDPRVASLALSRHGAEWLASANVTDGQDSYQVISRVGRVGGRWQVVALRSGG